jgi:hypothetical protein
MGDWLISIFTPEFALWTCVVLLFLILWTLARVGGAIAHLHEMLFKAHETEIREYVDREIKNR